MTNLDARVSAVLGLGSEVDASDYLYLSIPKEVGQSRVLSEVKGAEHSCWSLVLGAGTERDIEALDAERTKPRILHFQGLALVKDSEQEPPDFQTEEFQVVFSIGAGRVAVVYEDVWIRQRSNMMLISAAGDPLPA